MATSSSFNVTQLAIPAVSTLIIFLAYSSQYLFLYIEPEPLTTPQLIKFNTLLCCLWICYARACAVNPGHVPEGWRPKRADKDSGDGMEAWDNNAGDVGDYLSGRSRQRWCRRCEALKPPRAHHCKTCQRCIPKMDHHCPWTANCVSHFTFPHFIRFLLYAVTSMIYLEYFLYVRGSIVWRNRNIPSYFGPSLPHLSLLFVLFIVNSFTLFTLSVLLIRTLWMLCANTTTIEGWEISRHRTLVRRARVLGGFLDGPDGTKIRIRKQEFPYDIGFWKNMRDGMGSANVVQWFWPFATTPRHSTGLEYEANGFEDADSSWPPPDPDRIPRHFEPIESTANNAFTADGHFTSGVDEIEAFRRRQQADIQRREGFHRRRPFHERYAKLANDSDGEGGGKGEGEYEYDSFNDASDSKEDIGSSGGEEAWRDPEGDRLGDFGVDEDAEFYDEDDIPLARLIEQRRSQARGGAGT